MNIEVRVDYDELMKEYDAAMEGAARLAEVSEAESAAMSELFICDLRCALERFANVDAWAIEPHIYLAVAAIDEILTPLEDG